ncbi:hypothetical protein [uncultured Chloroflexus sp.]|uniref:hypothetical protein n=1 Tax=uncultured Chloroflexus sp. TaxID=214040 RepID=UPI002628988F|nr:hypothetical protein [uncultured Chloroflexus sp.]
MIGLLKGWLFLVERFPRTMLVIHLLIGMAAVGNGLYLAGFDWKVQLIGVAFVPALWGWVWLTVRQPMIFMPINTVLVGGGLWIAAQLTSSQWQPTWFRLTTGIPLIGNLPLLSAVLPTLIWVWVLGTQRWPRFFQPLNLLVLGAIACFLLLRVWTEWQPLWETWVRPVPVLPQVTGWLILLLPLGIWLWQKGQVRWPLLFTIFNLLIFGGMLGLTAYHTQPAWLATWYHWMAGLPFAVAPILTISLTPITLWGWNQVSRRWAKICVIPNLLLTGSIMWLILDRTRSLWGDKWQTIWGDVPLRFDPALLVFVLPLAVWTWHQARQRWPHSRNVARVVLWGGALWWIAERTRSIWYEGWKTFTGQAALDLALLALLLPFLCWIWSQLYRRWPKMVRIVTWIGVTVILMWTIGRLLPESTTVFRTIVAFLPLCTWGWLRLLHYRPRIGWPATLLPFVGVGLLAWLAPEYFQAQLSILITWLAEQGMHI